jgi:hypothetical protein
VICWCLGRSGVHHVDSLASVHLQRLRLFLHLHLECSGACVWLCVCLRFVLRCQCLAPLSL